MANINKMYYDGKLKVAGHLVTMVTGDEFSFSTVRPKKKLFNFYPRTLQSVRVGWVMKSGHGILLPWEASLPANL